MIRNILTIVGIFYITVSILTASQGEVTIGLRFRLAALIIGLLFLWIPPRIAYRINILKELDRRSFQYAWFRRVLKAIVGKKEYEETVSLLENKKEE